MDDSDSNQSQPEGIIRHEGKDDTSLKEEANEILSLILKILMPFIHPENTPRGACIILINTSKFIESSKQKILL
ncbi:hypothetical protein IEQ34_021244 [Dendrobium chrysotoxum]|uniref:Uncharacterized protein n=1 Tax=Dendrobium chrysotoxum TaxID=161865 RepID=A0AAV7G2Z3_DENCH|nr:hypothetical protein IEQ34_021244 [Dendrobium chrysotoxum]